MLLYEIRRRDFKPKIVLREDESRVNWKALDEFVAFHASKRKLQKSSEVEQNNGIKICYEYKMIF